MALRASFPCSPPDVGVPNRDTRVRPFSLIEECRKKAKERVLCNYSQSSGIKPSIREKKPFISSFIVQASLARGKKRSEIDPRSVIRRPEGRSARSWRKRPYRSNGFSRAESPVGRRHRRGKEGSAGKGPRLFAWQTVLTSVHVASHSSYHGLYSAFFSGPGDRR